MIEILADSNSVNTVSHLIQLAVAPVFVLAGVAGVLNVFVGRLSRIIDKDEIQTDKLQEQIEGVYKEEIRRKKIYLDKRVGNMNYAILFCTMTGFLVSLVIMIMFLSAFFAFNGAFAIATLFIMAMTSFVTALSLFLREIFMASLYFKGRI